jgi:hypothetical protein
VFDDMHLRDDDSNEVVSKMQTLSIIEVLTEQVMILERNSSIGKGGFEKVVM